ncbi:MAG: nitrite reductase/ring-hydroxylating ferredoxin subunit [Motiliproteus sp.]|jgi:nitrite reductase/ring-hydroxylating ferredoxin subunit
MYQLCHIDAIPEGQSKGLLWGQQTLIAVKRQGQLYLYRNRCPHRGIPLEWLPDQFLDLERQFIQCSTHGALFTLESGLCIQGPCQGLSLEPIDYTLIAKEVWISEMPVPTIDADD